MSKIIIGIHGLANKPKREKLKSGWLKAIKEGLDLNCNYREDFEFESVYWADLMYDKPIAEGANKEPYIRSNPGALKEGNARAITKIRHRLLEFGGRGLDKLNRHLNSHKIRNTLLKSKLKDLGQYYDTNHKRLSRSGTLQPVRRILRDELIGVLNNHKRKQILLIAHSMGSIVAYDVLRELGPKLDAGGQATVSGESLKIPHFVTIGSPLGLPHVVDRIRREHPHHPIPRTPSLVTRSWTNHADRKDIVAMDLHLRDDYRANARGVRVIDDLVANDYVSRITKKANHHKSYGYLRTPEMSRLLAKFLS